MPVKTIAVILGSSEKCIPITEQFLLSFYRNVMPMATNVHFDIHLYKCNLVINNHNYFQYTTQMNIESDSFSFSPFLNPVQFDHLKLSGLTIIMHDCSCSSFKYHFPLPDIALYQDFCDKYMDDYDYLMFCHNDVAFFRKTDMIDKMIVLLDGPRYNIISETSANFNSNLSVRFHPAMIFVKSSMFKLCNLSFINNLSIFNKNGFRIFTDGGAGLMASYYHESNKSRNRPYNHLPDTWFTHIRSLGDTGVEFCYHKYKESKEFIRAIELAQKYVDFTLYGSITPPTRGGYCP